VPAEKGGRCTSFSILYLNEVNRGLNMLLDSGPFAQALAALPAALPLPPGEQRRSSRWTPCQCAECETRL